MASRSSSNKTRRTNTTRRRATRRASRRRPRHRPRRLTLDQRSLDVIGLGLVALAVFLGCVLYGHWNGGAVGNGAASAFGWAFGRVREGVPIAVAGMGALFVLRPLRVNQLRRAHLAELSRG